MGLLGFPLFSMLEDALHHCPIAKGLIKDVLVDEVVKVLQLLCLTSWLLRDMCFTYKGSLPQSVGQWHGQLKHLQ